MISSLVNRQPASKSVVQGLLRHAARLRQVFDDKFPPHVFVKDIRSSISCLLMIGGPHTVLRLISAINILAVEGVELIWRMTHVRQECFVLFPSFANGNAAPSVVVERLVRSEITAIQHPAPHIPRMSPSSSVNCGPRSGDFSSQAAARQSATFFQVASGGNRFFPALTQAAPHGCVTRRYVVEFLHR